MFLRGQPPQARTLRMTSLKEEILEVQVDALCVWRRKKLWIISSYTDRGFPRFEIYLSLMGITYQKVGSLEEKDEEKLGPWSLEHGSFGYLVGYVEGEKSSYL